MSSGNMALTWQLSWLQYLCDSRKAAEASSDVPTNPQFFYKVNGRGFLGQVVKANCLFLFWCSGITHDRKACENLAVPKLEIPRLFWPSRCFLHNNYLFVILPLSVRCGYITNVRKQIGLCAFGKNKKFLILFMSVQPFGSEEKRPGFCALCGAEAPVVLWYTK